MKRYIYEAKLLPIGEPVRIPFDDGTPCAETLTFNDKSFEIERTSKTKPEIWLNHSRDLRIGKVAMLYTSREGWWCCDFVLDRDVPDDLEFELGQPVSVGISQLKIGSGEPYLREISIVRRGAIEGAEITRRFEINPAPVKQPLSLTSSPAAVRASTRAVAGDAFDHYRPPYFDTLERKVGYPVTWDNFEAANVAASRTPLQQHWDEHVAAKREREPEVIRRYGIGPVLAVGGVPVR